VQDDVFLWVPGPATTRATAGSLSRIAVGQTQLSTGESATLIVRGETVLGPVLVTKEGQHVSWFRLLRPGATDSIQVPIDAGDVGDVFVNIAYLREGRLYRAERRLGVAAASRTLNVAVTAQQAVSRPRDPGVFDVTVTDQADSQCARRSASRSSMKPFTVSRPTTLPIRSASSTAANTRVLGRRSRARITSRVIRDATGCS
jgi:hypothetical protein